MYVDIYIYNYTYDFSMPSTTPAALSQGMMQKEHRNGSQKCHPLST